MLIYSEIVSVVGSDRAVHLTDRETCHTTEHLFLELVRFFTVSPMSIPHRTLQDTTLGGVHIPKGTAVIANYLALHHGQATSRPDRLQLGAGPRFCICEQLALARIFLFLTNQTI